MDDDVFMSSSSEETIVFEGSGKVDIKGTD